MTQMIPHGYAFVRALGLSLALITAVANAADSPEASSEKKDAAKRPAWVPLAAEWRSGNVGPALSARDLFEKVGGAVWTVYTSPRDQLLSRLKKGRRMSQGSAVAIDEHRLITNCHVIKGASDLTLAHEKRNLMSVELIAADGPRDLCVLRTAAKLPVYVNGFCRFDDLAVGEVVFAIGSPEGYDRSITDGLVSGKRKARGPRRGMSRIIQTSAVITRGSSGGGLFDAHGNLVGVTSFVSVDGGHLGFAISIEDYTTERPVAATPKGK
jgi:S1-C subfamily serine protease